MTRHQHSRRQRPLAVERLDARQVMSATAINFEIPDLAHAAIISHEGVEAGERATHAHSFFAALSPNFDVATDTSPGPFQNSLRLNHAVTDIIKAHAYPLESTEDGAAGVRALETLLHRPPVESKDETALLFNQTLNFEIVANREDFAFSPIILWRQVFSGDSTSINNFTIEASAAPQEIEMLESPREGNPSGPILGPTADVETNSELTSGSNRGAAPGTTALPRGETSGTTPAMRFENAVDRILMRSSLRNDPSPSEDHEGGLLTIDPLSEAAADIFESKANQRKVSVNLEEIESLWTALVETMFPSSPQKANRAENVPGQDPLSHHVAACDDLEGGMVELDSTRSLQAETPINPPQTRFASRPSNLETGVAFFTEFDLSTSPINLGEPRDNVESRRPKNARNAAAEVPTVETDLHSAAMIAPLFFVGMVFATTSEERELPWPGISRSIHPPKS